MKKVLQIVISIAALALAVPGLADVLVTTTVDKTKDVDVYEQIIINKWVDIDVLVEANPERAAESGAILNQRTEGYSVTDEEIGGNFRSAVIAGSINENVGIVGVNQDAGNANNQGNVVSVAVSLNGNEETSFTNAQAAASQYALGNVVVATEDFTAGPHKQALIGASILGNRGIVGVNQSVGNMNNQGNLVALAVAANAAVALSEADLGQTTAYNRVVELGTVKVDTIVGSVNNNYGVVGVNQSSGSMNNQANVVSVATTFNFTR